MPCVKSLIAATTAASLSVLTSLPAIAQSFTLTAADEAQLRQRVEEGAYGTVTSVAILHQGETTLSLYAHGADATTLHDTRSVTKTITGYAVSAAIARGELSLQTRVADHFPDYADAMDDPRKRAITVEDLLTMSGPLECNDWSEFSRGNEERMYLVEDWTGFFWTLPVRGYPAWVTPPDETPYGRAFSYCTAGVQLLGELVERATGQAFTAFTEHTVLAPLGIETVHWSRNGQGQAHMGGGLRLTTLDLARLGELQRLDGVWQGSQVLAEGWAEAALTPRADIPNTPGYLYGYLWWLMPYEVAGDTYWAAAMTGNGGNRVMVLPDFALTVVFTNTDFNTPGMHQNAQRFFETEIVARLDR